MTREQKRYMRRCLELAERGRMWTHPNPMVGCVIVRRGRVVGEAWHRRFGGPHAEILALRSAGRNARGATMYVNLEPCSHFGKTPPCVNAIIDAGISAVIAPAADPNPEVSGRGFRRLRQAGINVTRGVLKKEAMRFNEKFYRFMETGVPFVGIKIAQTLDGRIADWLGTSKWITSQQARTYGHRLRAEYDAVLVGARTVRKDNPALTVRFVRGKNPVRIVLDGKLSIAVSSRICDTRKARTIIVTSLRALRSQSRKAVRLERRGVEVLGIDSHSKLLDLRTVLKVLGKEGIGSVLIEGGSETISHFLEQRQAAKIHCFVAPRILGSGISGITLSRRRLSRALELMDPDLIRVGNDVVIEAYLQKSFVR